MTIHDQRSSVVLLPSKGRLPKWLQGPIERATWRKLAPVLCRSRVLTVADELALALLCQAVADYVEIRRDPSGRRRSAALRSVITLLGEFGLSPASRSRIVTTPDPEYSPMEEFLRDVR